MSATGPAAVEACPVCGTRLKVVRDKELFNCVKGVEVVDE